MWMPLRRSARRCATSAPRSRSAAANQTAGQLARGAARLDAELDRLRPGFDIARQRAVREFGRVQVLKKLANEIRDAGKERR